jgi:carbon monoxide dehydrogenase subunit G
MKQTQLIHTLPATPEVAFQYLTDMNLFASIHPVISRIEPKGNDHYLVFETLRLGPLPVSFTYPVLIEQDISIFYVYMKAIIFKLTTVEMSFTIIAENGITTIEENIYVKSIPPLNSLTLNVIKTQHHVLFNNIAKDLCH